MDEDWSPKDRIKHRPDAETLAKYRMIIVHWDQTLRAACQDP